MDGFELRFWDYAAFVVYIAALCLVGFLVGRRRQGNSTEYFLAGRGLPWYVVGTSFIASNISTEHFIGMVGSAFIFGIAPAFYEWGNVSSFTLIIWLFIPFLLAARVFTIPEYMERRFNPFLRQFFAVVTIISNIVAFLAAVLYGGGLALSALFGWELWPSILILAIVAGSWAIYGGLRSVAWTDFITVIVMLLGGVTVTILGLQSLGGESGSLVEGFRVMIERNQAETGVWKEAVAMHARDIVQQDEYNRLSLFQPVTHTLIPWPMLIFTVFSISIWYNVCNQFMIQRVLGARDAYHARMGIVLAGYLKVFLPIIIVIPGLILFAKHPEFLLQPLADAKTAGDQGYIRMLATLVPVGLRGLFLAALFGAIQSTVNSVLNSTSTVFTLDVYRPLMRVLRTTGHLVFGRGGDSSGDARKPMVPSAEPSERHLVIIGMVSSVIILAIAVVLAGFIANLSTLSLFEYIQTLFAFFAPPFGAVFLLGILFKRINGIGATAGVMMGFAVGIAFKIYVQRAGEGALPWLVPFGNQAILNWAISSLVCALVSLATPRPAPEQVTDDLAFNWKAVSLGSGLGDRWYKSVVLWWLLFALLVVALFAIFSGKVI